MCEITVGHGICSVVAVINSFYLSFISFSKSSSGWRAALQNRLCPICGLKRNPQVSFGSVSERGDCFVVFISFVHTALLVLSPAAIGQAVHQLLLIQAFRPDRLLAVSHNFVAKVLGESFMAIIDQPLDLGSIVDSEVTTWSNAAHTFTQ